MDDDPAAQSAPVPSGADSAPSAPAPDSPSAPGGAPASGSAPVVSHDMATDSLMDIS